MFTTGFTSLIVLLLFPVSITFFVFVHRFDEVLLINPYADILVFGDFNVNYKGWLTYLDATDWPGKLYFNFSFSNDLTQMATFPTWIPTWISYLILTVLVFWIYLFLIPIFVLQWLSLNREILIMLLSQFFIDFPSNSQWDPCFIA